MDDKGDIRTNAQKSAKGCVNGIWPAAVTKGGCTAQPSKAGSMLSHFSRRCCLRELLFEPAQSPARFGNLFTIEHTSYPSCELPSQNTLNWLMKRDLYLPAPCKTFIFLSHSHITDVAANHLQQILSSKLHIKIQHIKQIYTFGANIHVSSSLYNFWS